MSKETRKLFPGSISIKIPPTFSNRNGKTWDRIGVFDTTGNEHIGFLDTSWGLYFYFKYNNKWRKALVNPIFDDNKFAADFGKKVANQK